MDEIITEVTIPLGEHKTVYSAQRVYIRVRDIAGGPFLAIEGLNDEPEEDESPHEFYLQTIKEIDEFAEICKSVLTKATKLDEMNPEEEP